MTNISGKITQLDQKVGTLYKQMEALEAEAKGYLQKSQQSKGSAKDMYKKKCLMALKKKKALEQQAKSLNAHQNILQQGIFNVEAANAHKQMYEGLKGAVEAQKEAIKKVDIDKFQQMQDEMLQMKMQSDMLNQMMSRNYDMDIDEQDIEDEFMQFQKQVKTIKVKEQMAAKQQINPIKGNQINKLLQ